MIFFLVFLTAAVKIEILPRYAGVDKGSVLITGTLQDYGLAAESAEGTYAFFYFHKAPAPVAVNVISSPSSSVQISESTFFSTWGALQADFLSAQASLSQWMLIVLSLSNPQSFQLDFTIFIGKQRLSFSVQDYYTASQSAFLPSDYFTIYGSTGIIHSLTIFPEVVSPVLISQYYLLPTYQCNSDIPLILNVNLT